MKFNWIGLSFIAFFSFAILITLFTYLTKKGYSVPFLLFVVSLLYTIFFGVQTLAQKQLPISLSFSTILLLLGLGIIGAIGNFTQFHAITIAPNSGLVIAIVNSFAGLVAIFAFLFFKESLTITQMLGLILSIIALILINIGASHK